MEFFVQQISAKTFRPMEASRLDFTEGIQGIREQFEVIERCVATGTIIELHADKPAPLGFARRSSDTALTFRSSDHADA